MAISVSIVEDDRETRESLAALLNGAPNMQCLATYATGEDGLRGIPVEKPDVALLDINLPGISGIDCVTLLKSQLPGLQVLMITTYEDRDLIFGSLRAGASGYLLKKMPRDKLIEAIKEVHAGGAPMSLQIARKVVDYFHKIQQPVSEAEKLTLREQEILMRLAEGLLYKEIGDSLGITIGTVRTHVMHIYEKLHVQCRTKAVAKFFGRD
jgi:DNA-binding NarL/FixJ family response regulator